MEGNEFLAALTSRLEKSSQAELAEILGIYQPQVSNLKKGPVSAKFIARVVAHLDSQVIRGDELVSAIRRKLGVASTSAAARRLGLTTAALCGWENQKKGISTKQVCNMLSAAQKQAHSDAQAKVYRPIIEMFPITPAKKTVKSDVFSDSNGTNHQRAGLKAELLKARGIYIFYDARGRALYVGQAAKQSLWKEMNDAYNRPRKAQTVALVKHPVNNVAYSAAHEKLRQPIDTVRKLVDLAAYFSAYEVDGPLIGDFEALFIRAFPNDLLNYKMEKPGKKAAKKAVAKS